MCAALERLDGCLMLQIKMSFQEDFAVAACLLVRCNGCVQVAERVRLGCCSQRNDNAVSVNTVNEPQQRFWSHHVCTQHFLLGPAAARTHMYNAMCLSGCLLSHADKADTARSRPHVQLE